LPPEPEEVEKPDPPDDHWRWEFMTDEEKASAQQRYKDALVCREEYEKALKAWRESVELRAAPSKLAETVRDIEQRGLIQYDGRERRYDLHPVVRAVAAGGMKAEDKERYGQRVVDHFSAQPHSPYENAQTLEDLSSGVQVVRTLLKLDRRQKAAETCSNDLLLAFSTNLEAFWEALSLLRPFFSRGWHTLPEGLSGFHTARMADFAGMALRNTGSCDEAISVHSAVLQEDLRGSKWNWVRIDLANLSEVLALLNRLSRQEHIDVLALDLSTVCNDNVGLFMSRLHRFRYLGLIGSKEAKQEWLLLDSMGREWPRSNYRPGQAELAFARFQFWQEQLSDDVLEHAELAATRSNHTEIRGVHKLRGSWRLGQGHWAQSASSFQEAVRMARERRLVDAESETGLALAKFHLGQLTGNDARGEANRLSQLRQPAHLYLAMLWLAICDPDQAKLHALAAYRWAWADGEPYVRRYELTKTTELLQQMNVPISELPTYDPARDEPFPGKKTFAAPSRDCVPKRKQRPKPERLIKAICYFLSVFASSNFNDAELMQ
jgi:hypothetical protein